VSDSTAITFEGLGLVPALSDALREAGFVAPTQVQVRAIPAILEGRDGVLVSPTGTGKTLAYLLPILQKLDGNRRETQAVVLAPTQELAMQIVREAERYGAGLGIKTVGLIGGASLPRQLDRMKAKPALVVGTPGRIREVAALRKLSLPAVRFVVVDETDRVFSLGGRSDVEQLIRQCSRDRQTIFVSATRTDAMREAERKWLKQPWVSQQAGQGPEAAGGLPDTIRHWYFTVDKRDKVDLVRRLVRHLHVKPILLFLNDIDKIGEVTAKLKYEGIPVEALYGDISGRERGEALRRFRAGRTHVLVATDVAARGLDVPGLPLVIQFEPALDADHYVHRAGRTGRMGREGVSVTFVAPQERFIVDKLARQLGIVMEPKTLYQGRVLSPEEAGRRRVIVRAAQAEGNASQAAPGNDEPSRAGSAKPSPARAAQAVRNRTAASAPQPKGKAKAERERDRKNKGAPRWLKAKRESGPGTDRA
jgi:superfamily II DNA/RNA helicase